MARVFLVICDSGEFESAQEHIVCAYSTREMAELHVEHCNAVGVRYAPLPPSSSIDDYAAEIAYLRKHWGQNEALYLEAMRDLDPEACVVDQEQGKYRVEETNLLNEVPTPPRATP